MRMPVSCSTVSHAQPRRSHEAEKLIVVALIAAETAARAGQLFHGSARAAETLARGRPSLLGVPFRVVSVRNTEHSEESNGQTQLGSATTRDVSAALWGDFTEILPIIK
ncbi:hypothetical protein NDU88_010279 [Pleurodeles waltl]|uniref:Uncharacterized protein n=1 Tax=Pleurodeles waltl TaxID=8319 RepID=A0AAV7PXK9_PLEWA|nr:hypothetical protein NDU88_010279 [Pleurodeles waltl]